MRDSPKGFHLNFVNLGWEKVLQGKVSVETTGELGYFWYTFSTIVVHLPDNF